MEDRNQIEKSRVGVVGCTFPGTLIFIDKLCQFSQQRFGHYRYPGIILEMRSLSSFMPNAEGVAPDWTALLAESVDLLQRSSCDIIVSPANSTQDALRKAINDRPGLRWIDIAQPVMSELSNRRSRRALLLATDATLASGLYHAGAGASGIEMITPDPIAQRSLNNLIVERLVCGEKTIADREFVVSLIAKGRERGADCVILGCTELCLLASDQNSALPVIDSNELLARAVVAALE